MLVFVKKLLSFFIGVFCFNPKLFDHFRALTARREYGEIATLLQGVMNVLDHLNRYKHIPQVADLARQVRDKHSQYFASPSDTVSIFIKYR